MPTVLEAINLGPGVLKIGATGSELDASCMINNAKIAMSKDTTDPRTMLCGDVKAGKTTYTYTLSGNLDTDIDDATGLFALSQSAPGSQQAYTFTPNSDTGTTATGTLVLDPLDFGSDESGGPLQSDFEFDLVGAPTYTYGTTP
jgi:hypothetical protein